MNNESFNTKLASVHLAAKGHHLIFYDSGLDREMIIGLYLVAAKPLQKTLDHLNQQRFCL